MHADSLRIDFGEYNVEAAVRSPMNSLFRGRNVSVAMQRNNPLRWIEEWARLCGGQQGGRPHPLRSPLDRLYADRTARSIGRDPRSRMQRDRALAVQVWRKAEIPGDPWDSDFGQYVAWEHAYRRFLQEARAVTVSMLTKFFWRKMDAQSSIMPPNPPRVLFDFASASSSQLFIGRPRRAKTPHTRTTPCSNQLGH